MLTKIRNTVVMAIAALGLVLTAGMATAGTHHHRAALAASEGTGTMSFAEWANVSEGQSQANVEAAVTCGCTGIVVNTWTNDGVAHKTVAYADAEGDAIGTDGAYLNYAKDFQGTWRTNNWAGWAAGGDGLEFKYDDGTGNSQVGIVGR